MIDEQKTVYVMATVFVHMYICTGSGERAAAYIVRTRLDAVKALGIEGAQAVEVGGNDRLKARPEQLEHRVPVEVEHRDGHWQSLVDAGRGRTQLAQLVRTTRARARG